MILRVFENCVITGQTLKDSYCNETLKSCTKSAFHFYDYMILPSHLGAIIIFSIPIFLKFSLECKSKSWWSSILSLTLISRFKKNSISCSEDKATNNSEVVSTKLSTTTGLASDDKFAIVIYCKHNNCEKIFETKTPKVFYSKSENVYKILIFSKVIIFLKKFLWTRKMQFWQPCRNLLGKSSAKISLKLVSKIIFPFKWTSFPKLKLSKITKSCNIHVILKLLLNKNLLLAYHRRKV